MSSYIFSIADKLVEKYSTRNPFEIAENIGIRILYNNDFSNLKGMYKIINKVRFIFINSNLEPEVQKIVCAHEIGHDMLHREMAKSSLIQEFALYDMKSRPEYEANIFASALLFSDEEIFQLGKDGYDIEQMSKILCTDINLIALKISDMNNRGYNFNMPYIPKSNFLK